MPSAPLAVRTIPAYDPEPEFAAWLKGWVVDYRKVVGGIAIVNPSRRRMIVDLGRFVEDPDAVMAHLLALRELGYLRPGCPPDPDAERLAAGVVAVRRDLPGSRDDLTAVGRDR